MIKHRLCQSIKFLENCIVQSKRVNSDSIGIQNVLIRKNQTDKADHRSANEKSVTFELLLILSSQRMFKDIQTIFFGEFDPGSGRTLAACLIHASRADRDESLLLSKLAADG